jgi:histidinol phosphatase-like PHP family hydrolase
MRDRLDKLAKRLYEYVYRTNERLIYYPAMYPFEAGFRDEISKTDAFNIDIHTHSCDASDGVNTITFGVQKAIERGLEGIGITDHDTEKHYPYCENLQKSRMVRKRDFLVIPGTEYTTTVELGNNRFGIAHIVGLSPDYKASKPIRKLVERTKELKKPVTFTRYSLDLGNRNILSAEEVIETLQEENHIVDIAHPWTRQGVRNRLKPILERYPEACVEVYNPRANLTFPKGIPSYVIKHGNLVAGSDTHMARLTTGDAFTKYKEEDVYGSDGKPSLEKVLEATRKGRTEPYLVPLNMFARNTDKLRFLHVPHSLRSLITYFNDEERVVGTLTRDALVGNEVDPVEKNHKMPDYE